MHIEDSNCVLFECKGRIIETSKGTDVGLEAPTNSEYYNLHPPDVMTTKIGLYNVNEITIYPFYSPQKCHQIINAKNE